MTEWAKRKDAEAHRKKVYREKTEDKLKRAKRKREEWNVGVKAGKKKKAADYGAGIAIDNPDLHPVSPMLGHSNGSSKKKP